MDELDCPRDGFDIVTLVELVEHLQSPGGVLSRVATLLRPGGLAFVTTPNGGSLNRRLLGSRWSIIAPPDHRVIFTPRGLRALLDRSGFSVCAMRATGFNPTDILGLLSRRYGSTDRVSMARAMLAAAESSPMRRGVKGAVNAVLSLTHTGDTLKAWAHRTR